MFSHLDNNEDKIRSTTGFDLVVLGAAHGETSFEYWEGAKKITVLGECGWDYDAGFFCVYIHPDVFSKWDGTTEVLSEQEQARILQNVRAAFGFRKDKLFVYGIDAPLNAAAQQSLGNLLGQLKQNPKVTSITLTNVDTGESHTMPNPPTPGLTPPGKN